MLLKHWAQKQGISYRTALRWHHEGNLPVKSYQNGIGYSILVCDGTAESNNDNQLTALYARVSSADQREDAQRQLSRLRDYCSSHGITVDKEVVEIGSCLNGRRSKLVKLLEDPTLNLVVEHPDRLARFGVEYISAVLKSSGRDLIIINQTESSLDLVQDFVDVVTSMCARIYGKRSAKNKAARAIEAAQQT